MYIPSSFAETQPEVLHDLIRKHPLGVLITHGSNGLDANHIPFELDAKADGLGVLHCHVARANPVWKNLSDGDEVLVIFQAGDAYISPNWYPSKHEFHKQVPTWNYVVVHAYGKAVVRDDEDYVRGVVTRLTATHEASEPVPWKLTDSSESLIDGMLKAIVGIEIEITRLLGKTKLSQNKDERDLRGAANALLQKGETAIGEAMVLKADEKSSGSSS